MNNGLQILNIKIFLSKNKKKHQNMYKYIMRF